MEKGLLKYYLRSICKVFLFKSDKRDKLGYRMYENWV